MNSNQIRPGYLKLMRAIVVIGSLLAIAGFIFLPKVTTALANTPDINNARARYPNITGTRIDSCMLCHTASIPNLNPYGAAYKANGRSTSALAAIESMDSDGDGYSNLAELMGLSFPGDPADIPVPPTATSTPIQPVPPTATPTATATNTPLPTATATEPPPPTATTPPEQPTATSPASEQPTATEVVPEQPTATMAPVEQPTATDVPPIQATSVRGEKPEKPVKTPQLICRTHFYDKDGKEYTPDGRDSSGNRLPKGTKLYKKFQCTIENPGTDRNSDDSHDD